MLVWLRWDRYTNASVVALPSNSQMMQRLTGLACLGEDNTHPLESEKTQLFQFGDLTHILGRGL